MATKDKARWQLGRIFCGISAARIGPEGSATQRTASEGSSMSFLLDTNAVNEMVRRFDQPEVG
jgi:hypothetical protein